MNLNEKLNYKAYEHIYQLGDILCLKSNDNLKKINAIFTKANKDNCNFIWCLTQDSQEILAGKKLKVISSISWHMGIPFYELKSMEENPKNIYLGEFYLTKHIEKSNI